MKAYLYIILLFSPMIILAQSSKAAIDIELTMEGEDFDIRSSKQKITKYFNKKYAVTEDAPIHLSFDIDLGEVRVLNGMDTYATAPASIKYKLYADNQTKQGSANINIKAKNERELRRKIGDSVVRNKKLMKELKTEISSFVSEVFPSCKVISDKIQKNISKSKIEAANAIYSYYDMVQNCEAEKEASDISLVKALHGELCDQVLHKAKILANSGQRKKLNQATDLLLMIPVDAPCNEEVLKVSEMINENAQKLNDPKIQERIIVRERMTPAEFRAHYYKNYRLYRDY